VEVTTNSPLSNWARYETIAPLTLSTGQTYYVSSVETNNGYWIGHILWGSGVNSNGTFTVGPGLSYLGTGMGTNADGTFPQTFYATNYMLIGPNFVYVTTTLMTMTGIQMVSGEVQLGFEVSGVRANSFTLLESDQPGGPWTTNPAAILTTNIPGVSYTFTTSPGGPVHFYRVQTP
jgi:hypothetical protein